MQGGDDRRGASAAGKAAKMHYAVAASAATAAGQHRIKPTATNHHHHSTAHRAGGHSTPLGTSQQSRLPHAPETGPARSWCQPPPCRAHPPSERHTPSPPPPPPPGAQPPCGSRAGGRSAQGYACSRPAQTGLQRHICLLTTSQNQQCSGNVTAAPGHARLQPGRSQRLPHGCSWRSRRPSPTCPQLGAAQLSSAPSGPSPSPILSASRHRLRSLWGDLAGVDIQGGTVCGHHAVG